MKKKWLIILIAIAFLQLVSAEHQISPTSFSIENEISPFTITVTNTDIESPAVTNITIVEITLPTSLIFVSETNSTSSLSIFTNTSNILTWTNTSYLIGSANGGDNSKTFAFNANATTFGIYNLTIKTTNSTSVVTKYIPLTIADNTAPEARVKEPSNNIESLDGAVSFECSATDNIDLDAITLYIYSGDVESYKNSVAVSGKDNETSWDYTFTTDGEYKWNCLTNDSSGNIDWSSNRTILVNMTSACTPNWNCAEWIECINSLQTRICTDLNNCNNNSTKPTENQSCCASNWNCTEYSPIKCPKEELQTRTCIDLNNCNDNTNKPAETMTCTYEGSSIIFVIVIVIICLIIAGIIATAIILYFKNDDQTTSPVSNTQNSNYMSP